eukprot:gene3857-2507_t
MRVSRVMLRAAAVAAVAAAPAAAPGQRDGDIRTLPNTDFDHGNATGAGVVTGIGSAAACCDQCWRAAACAAATFYHGTCWLKTASQARRPVHFAGATGCVRGGPAPALSVPAEVPGDLITDLH